MARYFSWRHLCYTVFYGNYVDEAEFSLTWCIFNNFWKEKGTFCHILSSFYRVFTQWQIMHIWRNRTKLLGNEPRAFFKKRWRMVFLQVAKKCEKVWTFFPFLFWCSYKKQFFNFQLVRLQCNEEEKRWCQIRIYILSKMACAWAFHNCQAFYAFWH